MPNKKKGITRKAAVDAVSAMLRGHDKRKARERAAANAARSRQARKTQSYARTKVKHV